MPILDIEVVLAAKQAIDPSWAQSIADIVGDVLGTESGRTWVRLRALAPSQYAEQGTEPPATPHPIFVSILQSHLPDLERKRQLAERLAHAIGRVCGRAHENVHILWLPEGVERVAFGGALLEG